MKASGAIKIPANATVDESSVNLIPVSPTPVTTNAMKATMDIDQRGNSAKSLEEELDAIIKEE